MKYFRFFLTALLLPGALFATQLHQQIQNPASLKGLKKVHVEVYVDDGGTKKFSSLKFQDSLAAAMRPVLKKGGLSFGESFDRVFADVYIMPLKTPKGRLLGHTIFMEIEVSRAGYFRPAEKKKSYGAEYIAWQGTRMASAGIKVKETKKFVKDLLKKELKRLLKDLKKAKKG